MDNYVKKHISHILEIKYFVFKTNTKENQQNKLKLQVHSKGYSIIKVQFIDNASSKSSELFFMILSSMNVEIFDDFFDKISTYLSKYLCSFRS